MGTIRKSDRTRCSGEFLHNEGVLEIALVETAILRGSGNTQQTHLAEFLPEVLTVQWNVSWPDVYEGDKGRNTIGNVFVRSISTARGAISFSANW